MSGYEEEGAGSAPCSGRGGRKFVSCLVALNVSADFASRNKSSFCKTPPHSAPRRNLVIPIFLYNKKAGFKPAFYINKFFYNDSV